MPCSNQLSYVANVARIILAGCASVNPLLREMFNPINGLAPGGGCRRREGFSARRRSPAPGGWLPVRLFAPPLEIPAMEQAEP